MSRRGGSRLLQRMRPWRWTLQAVGIGLVGLLLLVVVFAGPSERFCSNHRTGCGLATGFISTTLIAIGGYFFIVVWALRRAVPRYLDLARRTPERLLPTAGRVRGDEIVCRPGLAAAIATELHPSRRGAPVLVLGAAGAGKTTFLLELTRLLAASHVVPVPCSLRGAEPPLRLRAMAHKRFIEALDPLVRSGDHAERIWRRLCADGEIAVVVDALDELMPGRPGHERDQAIRPALATARNEGLPVVVASRPETVPLGAQVSVFELDPLAEDDAIRYLEDRIPVRSRPNAAALREFADVGRTTPYYLDVIAALHRAGRRPARRALGRDGLLVELLDGWVDLLLEQRLLREVELDSARRTAIVERLGAIAHAMTTTAGLEWEVEAVDGATDNVQDSEPRLSVSAVVDGASRLELVETFPVGEGTGVRFIHAISQAYFLSRLLSESPDAWRALVAGTPSAEMNRALVMWCARDGDHDRATEVGEALVARAAQLDADRALMLLVTAGEIASTVGDDFDGLDGDGVRASGAWSAASPRARLAAVRRLDERVDAWTLRALQERTRDENYRVRWAAAQAIAAGGDAAWRVLGTEFERTMIAAKKRPYTSWTAAEKHDISVMGWILPALARAVTEAHQAQAARLVETLADLVPDMPAGTEASLAQGFKLEALINPAGQVPPSVWTLLERAEFWYSRIVLAHAACIRTITDRAANPEAMRRLSDIARSDRHPFVAAAAYLCGRALRVGDRGPWVWDDEVAIITRSGVTLDDSAARLLADVVILLNLTEQGESGDQEARERRKEDVYRRDGLPHCLSESLTRNEVFDGCAADRCAFDLCPYPATADRAIARGEFSEAFCRHQREIVARRTSAPVRLARRRPARWSRLPARDAVRFWERMESRAS